MSIERVDGGKELLKKLYYQHCIGGKYLPENLCLRHIKHLRKEEHRKAIREWEKFIKEGLVLIKPKPGERHVSLNPQRISEIKKIIGEI